MVINNVFTGQPMKDKRLSDMLSTIFLNISGFNSELYLQMYESYYRCFSNSILFCLTQRC